MASTVLITGASQGCGKAAALRFAREGYDVVLTARHEHRLTPVAEAISAMGRSTLAVAADVSQPNQVQSLMEQALDRFDDIDVLVNNAGICLAGAFEYTTPEDWQTIINTNLWGYVNTIQALLPHFLHRGGGTIVNVGSIGGKMPLPYMTAYCTSKYAVTGLTEALRLELAPKHIHVGIVHPGLTRSNFMERAQFRGGDAPLEKQSLRQSEVQQRTRMEAALNSSWASSPDDVAAAIYEVVEKQRPEVLVGSAWLAAEAYRLAPSLVQWAVGQTLKSGE
jgi:short-subunit dehydrogenase